MKVYTFKWISALAFSIIDGGRVHAYFCFGVMQNKELDYDHANSRN